MDKTKLRSGEKTADAIASRNSLKFQKQVKNRKKRFFFRFFKKSPNGQKWYKKCLEVSFDVGKRVKRHFGPLLRAPHPLGGADS